MVDAAAAVHEDIGFDVLVADAVVVVVVVLEDALGSTVPDVVVDEDLLEDQDFVDVKTEEDCRDAMGRGTVRDVEEDFGPLLDAVDTLSVEKDPAEIVAWQYEPQSPRLPTLLKIPTSLEALIACTLQ